MIGSKNKVVSKGCQWLRKGRKGRKGKDIKDAKLGSGPKMIF